MDSSPDRPDPSKPTTPGQAELPLTSAFADCLFGEMGRGGSPVDPDAARDPSATWENTLEVQCRHVGVHTNAIALSWRGAIGSVQAGLPLVTWDPVFGWIALLETTADRIHALSGDGNARWLGVEDLIAGLPGTDPESVRTWLILEPAMPPGAIASDHALPPLRRLAEMVRPDRRDLLAVVLYAVFVGLLSLATPIAVQQLVNTVAFGGLVQPVVVLAVLLFAGLAFAGVLSTLQTYLAELIQRRVFVRACVDLADRLPRVAPSAFEGRYGPELVNRFLDLATLQKTGAALLLDGSSVVLQTTAGLLILSFYHPLMLGFTAVIVASIVCVLWLGRGATATAIGESGAKFAIAGWLEELARHASSFRNSDGRALAMERADALLGSWVVARKRHFRIVLRQIIGSTGLQVLINTLLLGIGGTLVVSGQLTLGQLVASEIIVATVIASFARLGKQLESYYDLLAAVDKIGVLLDLPLERDFGRPPRRATGPVAIEATRVGARSSPWGPCLEGISVQVGPGERLAIEGSSASSRSMLIDLLCGLRSPESGYVTLDGEDLRDLRLESVRSQIVCIRNPEVFAGTIVDNLRIGRAGASMDDLCAALESVGLLHELRMNPDGLYTLLSSNGWPLSQSQMARLMLARAIVARPRVLALDDAFAHLDDDERRVCLAAVLASDAPWTALVASSDRSVLAHCTRTFRLPHDGADDRVQTDSPASEDGSRDAKEDRT